MSALIIRGSYKGIAESPARILRAVLRIVLRRVDLLQKVDGLARFFARPIEHVRHTLIIDGLKAPLNVL